MHSLAGVGGGVGGAELAANFSFNYQAVMSVTGLSAFYKLLCQHTHHYYESKYRFYAIHTICGGNNPPQQTARNTRGNDCSFCQNSLYKR